MLLPTVEHAGHQLESEELHLSKASRKVGREIRDNCPYASTEGNGSQTLASVRELNRFMGISRITFVGVVLPFILAQTMQR